MLRWTLLAVASVDVAALVLTAPLRSPAGRASHGAVRMAEPVDDEGNSVQGISTGVGFEEAKAAILAGPPTLDPEKAKMIPLGADIKMTDLDFDISCSSMDYAECAFDVRPMMNTFEEFIVGLTADSHPSFTLTSEFEGTMARRGGEPTEVAVKCDPGGQAGEFVAYVAFMLPEEKPFSTYYKITCTAK